MGLVDGKIAIVTGAGAGLGRSYAMALAAEGASVIVNDLAPAKGKEKRPSDAVVAEIEKAGGTAIADYSDVTSVAGGEALLAAALKISERFIFWSIMPAFCATPRSSKCRRPNGMRSMPCM